MAEFKDKMQDAVQNAETEVKRLIQYLNDEVVPKVRKEGAEALGAAAEQLRELAQRLEKRR
ncbi:MAG: hypothetical protein JSS87_00565 [Acidobacteria bacterium]|nr:hypothetical protein [Acidobacteriota bacterium]